MAKILLIAQGEYIARYAREVQAELPDPDELVITVAHMEGAVSAAQQQLDPDTEVIVARGISANLLREADLGVPVVEIPITNEEIFRSITRARALSGSGSHIGILGFKEGVSSLVAILGELGFRITVYDVRSTLQNLEQIDKAKRDGVAVLICGERSAERVANAGMKAVVIETSLDSIRQAYRKAKDILDAVTSEKKKSREATTIFDSVSDAIVSLDASGRVTLFNRHAQRILRAGSPDASSANAAGLFFPREMEAIEQVVQTGEEQVGGIIERHGVKYVMRAVPIVVQKAVTGVVVTLQEIRALQRMEATVRKRLSPKGYVARYSFDDIKGSSGALRETVEVARSFARLHSNVLIIGETGTGKELFAQSIHNASIRKDRPFVAVNCGAIPANLVESELFGHEEGAFTGSRKGGKMGLFELAHSGTIFLDEISEMDPSGQVNLLRALQERQIRRVGGDGLIPVDVRVIAACNTNLNDMVRAGRFRRDLYYRLSVLVLKIPPLRQRQSDVSELADHFIGLYNERFGKNVSLSDAAMRELESFRWDGNIRQLRNFCERLTAVADDPVINAAFVQKNLLDSVWDDDAPSLPPPPRLPAGAGEAAEPGDALMIKGVFYTKNDLVDFLARYRGNREAVAKHLGVSRTTLWKYLKRSGIPT